VPRLMNAISVNEITPARVSDRGEVRLLLVWGAVLFGQVVFVARMLHGRGRQSGLNQHGHLIQHELDAALKVARRLPANPATTDETCEQTDDCCEHFQHGKPPVEELKRANAPEGAEIKTLDSRFLASRGLPGAVPAVAGIQRSPNANMNAPPKCGGLERVW